MRASVRALQASVELDSLPLDIIEPDSEVQVVIREDGKAMWLNVDGRCVCRVGRIPPGMITIEDQRRQG